MFWKPIVEADTASRVTRLASVANNRLKKHGAGLHLFFEKKHLVVQWGELQIHLHTILESPETDKNYACISKVWWTELYRDLLGVESQRGTPTTAGTCTMLFQKQGRSCQSG